MACLEKRIAIIGGSGVVELPQLKYAPIKKFNTKFQKEADSTFLERAASRWFGALGPGVVEYQEVDDIIFIKRHGFTKGYAPSETQYIANLIAAKMLGAEIVIGTTAVGSLHKDRICVEDLVVPHTYIDETQGRVINPFGSKLVPHANRWPTFSEGLRKILIDCAKESDDCFEEVHEQGTYVCIPGDSFGTEGEHNKRKQYADIVGMTIFPEALAFLFGMPYASAAFVVDLDKDASHEHGTRAIMRKMSEPHRVPAYMQRVINKTRIFVSNLDNIKKDISIQLVGNIIDYCPEKIENKYLRHIALHETIRYI
ncbi:MAG: hypothetical protein ABIG89_05685 [Candidatus Woesearchaeota archaeon]